MRSKLVLGAAILSTLIATDAYARGPGAIGGGPAAFAGHGGPSWQGSYAPGFSRGLKTGWNGASVPPGWSKGKKKGWNGQGVPPGLYGR